MRHALLAIVLAVALAPLACGPEPAPDSCADVPSVCLAVLPELGERPISVGEAALCEELAEIDARLTTLERIAEAL